MKSTLAIHLISSGHYVAFSTGEGSTALLADSVLKRPLRPSAYSFALTGQEVWVGGAALVSELAGLGESPTTVAARYLGDEIIHKVSSETLTMSASTGLSLLVRRACIDAASEQGAAPEKVVVVLDELAIAVNVTRLAWMLGEYCSCETSIETAETALEAYLRARCKDTTSGAVLAFLGSNAYIGQYAVGGKLLVRRIDALTTFERFREDLMSVSGAGNVDAWVKDRLWRDFIAWAGTAASTGAEPFEPHAIDVRLNVCALSLSRWLPQLDQMGADVARELTSLCAEVPDLDSLWIVSDSALAAFWEQCIGRQFPTRRFKLRRDTPDRIAREAASAGLGASLQHVAPTALGLLLRKTRGAAKEFVAAPASRTPYKSRALKVNTESGQSMHRFEVAADSGDGQISLLRRIVFKHRVDSDDSRVVEIFFDVSPMGALRLRAVDVETNEALRLLTSEMPLGDDVWASGPEVLSAFRMSGERIS